MGDIRDKAAECLEIPRGQEGRVKLFFKGRNLKDDGRRARDEGLRSDVESELLCVVGDAPPQRPGESDEDEEDEGEEIGEGETGGATPKKKRRNRKKKNKKGKGGGSGTATPTSSEPSNIPNPDATYVPSHAPPSKPATPAPGLVATPKSPMEQLDAIVSKFHTTLVPQCVTFMQNPPADKAKKEFEHKKLAETVMAQILLKLDAVPVEDDESGKARARRKEIVREVQGMLNSLDDVVK